MFMTYADAEQAVDAGSYKTASDEVLQEMHKLCLNVSGGNVTAVDRVRRKGDIIREELSSRERLRRERQESMMISSVETQSSPSARSSPRDVSTTWDQN